MNEWSFLTMKTFILYTKNSIDKSYFTNEFIKHCKKHRIDYSVTSLNIHILEIMSKALNLPIPKIQSFIVDDRILSYRDGRIYQKVTDFSEMFEHLKKFIDIDYQLQNFEQYLNKEYNLITDLDNIKQLNYIRELDEDSIVLNIEDFRFRVKNSKLINTLKDFDQILNDDVIINLGTNYGC